MPWRVLAPVCHLQTLWSEKPESGNDRAGPSVSLADSCLSTGVPGASLLTLSISARVTTTAAAGLPAPAQLSPSLEAHHQISPKCAVWLARLPSCPGSAMLIHKPAWMPSACCGAALTTLRPCSGSSTSPLWYETGLGPDQTCEGAVGTTVSSSHGATLRPEDPEVAEWRTYSLSICPLSPSLPAFFPPFLLSFSLHHKHVSMSCFSQSMSFNNILIFVLVRYLLKKYL